MRGNLVLTVALSLALSLSFPAAAADDPATLVADRVFLTGTGTLSAEGNVEVFYHGAHLTAGAIRYDPDADLLAIEGPIQLTDTQGTVILADAASLSRDLTDGILESARVVLDRQLQIASDRIERSEGRYTRMERVVASSCEVCPANPVPLWEIRAGSVTHDQEARQLYFRNAQFRFAGVPLLYTPWLRMPDPTLDRATGLLFPVLRSTSTLGTGLKLPYFIAMGDSRDLTLTPYLATARTRTLEFRYREAFVNGTITVEGAASRDDILPGDNRGYLFGTGSFDLPGDFTLSGELRLVSDPSYLLDYDVSDLDRLRSGIDLTRTRRNEYILGSLSSYHSIREGDDNDVLPSPMLNLLYERRFAVRGLGGEGGFRLDLGGLYRKSDVDTDANGDGVTDGRDVARVTMGVDWRRNWVLGNGLVASGMFDLAADFYSISQDVSYPATIARFTPTFGAELRWPLFRTERGGASQVLEPVAQIVWSPEDIEDVPVEDSGLVELDEGNLFSLNRFPGNDLREEGLRANLGVSWTRYDPAGWSASLATGRVLNFSDTGQFTEGSGLSGDLSDWLVAGQLTTANGLTFVGRGLFEDDLNLTRGSLSVGWQVEDYGLQATYLTMIADPAEDRPDDTSELSFAGNWQVSEGWRGRLSARHDFTAGRTAYAGLGLEYRSECAVIDLSLSRRFTSSTSVTPTTDFNVSVSLGGIGAGSGTGVSRRSCIR